jgi:hypothetical protein
MERRRAPLAESVAISATVDRFLGRGQHAAIFKATRCSRSLRHQSPPLDDPELPT